MMSFRLHRRREHGEICHIPPELLFVLLLCYKTPLHFWYTNESNYTVSTVVSTWMFFVHARNVETVHVPRGDL